MAEPVVVRPVSRNRRLLAGIVCTATIAALGLVGFAAPAAAATGPSVTVNEAAGQADPASEPPITFTATFSESVTGFTAGDVSFAGTTAGGTLTPVISGSGATYTISVTGTTTTGNVVVSIPAGAVTNGNPSTASTSTDNSVAWVPDTIKPDVTINQAAGQADPTGTSPIDFTAAFSEPVTGFTPSDISFQGSTAGGTLAAAISGGSTTYTVSITGMTTPGSVIVSIPAGAASDPNSNTSTASTSTDNSVAWTTPTVVKLTATPASGDVFGGSVTLKAVLTNSGGTPTGTVDFTANSLQISPTCTNATITTVLLTTSASCTTTALPGGALTLKAAYAGDGTRISGSSSITYTVAKATPTVTLAGSPASPAVFGQPVTFTATVHGPSGASAPTGTIKFTVGGALFNAGCGAVALAPVNGTATATCTTPSLPAGSNALSASYSGDASYAVGTPGTLTYVINKAATKTTLTVSATTLTANITAVAPGAGVPTGLVTFTVDGATVGTGTLNASGVATLAYSVTTSANHTVGASYGGDTHFTASSTSTTVRHTNPKIRAHISSAHPKSGAGWYRSPVTITFTCTVGSAPLTATCPATVRLTHNVTAASVTRNIHATDGGFATVTVSPINIDRTAPHVSVHGVTSGRTYRSPGPTPRCVAHDARSGIATCRLHRYRSNHGHTVHYTATATDKAGNKDTIHGHYKIK